MGLRELLFGIRDTLSNPIRMVGFPTDGGLTSGGVTATTTLGLSAVWRCIDILSNGVSQLEWREREGIEDVEPSRLVVRPQAQRTRREWTSLVVSTLALYDVCYLWKAGGTDPDGVPLGLWYLDPTIVMPSTTDMFTQSFLLPPAEYLVGAAKVPRDQLVVLHRSPQPGISDDVGGIINIARTTFAAAIAAERYASRYWQGGGSPTTVLETDQQLRQNQIDDTLERWREKRAQGPDNPPILHSGLKARSFGADPTSEAAVEARRELVADIGRYFGIPTRILNAPTGDSETYTSTPAANLDLVRWTLQNYIGAIEDGVSEVLPPPRRMVMSTRKLTMGTQYEQAQMYQLATGNRAWMLPEEVREDIGMPPLGDPVSLAQLGGSLLEMVTAGLVTEAEARARVGLAPIDWGADIGPEESTMLIAQVNAGLRTQEEARAILGLAPADWGDSLSGEEHAQLMAEVAAGIRSEDEVRALLKLPPMQWPESVSKEESDQIIAQVESGLMTPEEGRAAMKLPPMTWDESLSHDEVADLIAQVNAGLRTTDEARAIMKLPPIVWPDDISEKVTQLGELIKMGFDPADASRVLGLTPIKHLGLPPSTLQKAADAALLTTPEEPPAPEVVASNGRSKEGAG